MLFLDTTNHVMERNESSYTKSQTRRYANNIQEIEFSSKTSSVNKMTQKMLDKGKNVLYMPN